MTIQQTVNYAVYLNLHSGSCIQMFFKIVALKNFAVFIGKNLCCSLFSNNCSLLKRDSDTGVFL